MADGQALEPLSEITDISQQVGRMSDRAIQRLVGGNAFLRGRIYARRNAVTELATSGLNASCKVIVRADEQVNVKAEVNTKGEIVSHCNCQAWRGPDAHCKHVAALLVALRDRERPPKPKEPQPASVKKSSASSGSQSSQSNKRRRSRRKRRSGSPITDQVSPVFNASNASASVAMGKVEIISTRQLGLTGLRRTGNARSGLDAWLPEDELLRPCEFEYRVVVRAASITVTPVLTGTRNAVPINETLGGFNTVPVSERTLLRTLARHAPRGMPATAELRGEDAAEVLAMLRGRRVLLEPASKELRFVDEPLRPKIELDLANAKAVRVRVVFESSKRRFPLSSGAWFEGTPGWHIDTTEGVARPVMDSVTPAWLQRLYRSPALVQPMNDLPRLLVEYIPRVAASLGTDLPDLSSVADVLDAPPRFQLRASGDIVGAEVRLRVRYNGTEYPVKLAGLPSPLAFQPPAKGAARPRVVRRDVGTEMTAVQELFNLGFEIGPTGEELVARGDKAVRFWVEGISKLPKSWERLIPDDLAHVVIRDKAVVPRVRVSSGIDWLSLDLTFTMGDIAVDEDELRMCLEKGRHLVKLQDGSYAPVKAEQVGEILSRMAEIVATSGSRKKLPLSQAGRIQDLLKLVSDQKITSTTKEIFQKLDHIEQIESVSKPRTFKGTLRPYQKDGFSWLVFLHELGTGGILADDMGLGKTIQAIALLLWVKAQQKERQIHLVVAPTSVVPNWMREMKRFSPTLKSLMWQGPDRHNLAQQVEDVDVLITSYALLRRDEEFLQSLQFGYAILDEAQNIKNPLSATAHAAKKLKADHRLAMTGTPIENRLSEIWSIFDYVSPGLLGDLNRFEEKIARPIDRGDERSAIKLRATIHPFVLRRVKSDVEKDLPPKIEQDIFVPMADEQANLYKQILQQVRANVLSEVEKQGVARSQIQILAALTRLRQVACDPRLIKLEGNWNDDESGKLSALREIMQSAVAGGHRTLIFSQFVEMLKLIRTVLDGDGVNYEYLDGSTKDRIVRVDRFNGDSSVQAFLVSLKAGGTGLNLIGADTVIHFDPWWNPAVEDQATDRAHRIGQTRTVTIYRLIAQNTVEEKIMELSAKKRELVTNVLNAETGMKGLTRADIDELFS
ncbi:MAG: DEAD/DEAH box helicase family protein [Deltaproteobacteria bacterium]|nr:DEAD/DEAH box helicase family protein [Deltaproteobacteria bacterium]